MPILNGVVTRVPLGIDKLHLAQLVSDSSDALVYDTLYSIPNVRMATATMNQNTETLYADNAPKISYSSKGDVSVEIEHINWDDVIVQLMQDNPMQGAVMHVTNGTRVPKMGVAYRITYDDDTYKYVKVMKVTFNTPELSAETQEDSPNFQTRTVEGTGVQTDYQIVDDQGRSVGLNLVTCDTTHPDYAGEGDAWFDVMWETPATLVVTPSINDGDTGVPVNTTVTFTTNNEMVQSFVESSANNFLSEDGVGEVAGTLLLDSARTLLTFTPDADLTATKGHAFNYRIKDRFNQELSGIINFTTV